MFCNTFENPKSKLEEALSKGPEEVTKVLNESGDIRESELRSALREAATNGYLDVFKILLEHNAEIKEEIREKMYLLQPTCKGGNVEIFKLLMEKGIKLIDGPESYEKNTALHIAANGVSDKIVELLLDNGLKLEETNRDGMTALHFAAKNKNEKILNLLLNRGANIEAKCEKNQTAVFYASAQGLENNVKLLIQKGAKIGIADRDGATCLKFAIKSGNESLVNLILDSGADINAGSRYRSNNPLWTATDESSESMNQLLLDRGAVVYNTPSGENSILHNACKQGFVNIVKQLIERGANVQGRGREDQTVLHAAAESGNESTARLILDLGLDVNGRDKRGLTPLHYAAIDKHLNLIEFLVSSGAYINAKDKSGVTAVYYSTIQDHEDAVKWLLEHGACIELTSINYNVHIMQSFYSMDRDLSFDYLRHPHTVLHVAAERDNKSIAKLFLDHGIDPNIRGGNNLTALHIASMEGRTEIVKLLLDRGADTTIKSQDELKESTALHLACVSNYRIGIVTLLLDSGANINDQDKMGYSALFIAIREQNRNPIRILLNNGANSELEDNRKYTPLLYAIIQSKKEYKEQLKERSKNRYYSEGDYSSYDCDDDICYDNRIIVERLLDHGVNIDALTSEESPTSALKYAIDHYDLCLTELLLNYKADINKVTLEGRSLTGKSYHDDASLGDIITKHIVKLLSKGEFVGEDASNFIKSNAELVAFQEKCQIEIDKMKNEIVRDSMILLYDILTSENPSQMAAFARNEDMLQSFESANYWKSFPIYKSTLDYQIRKGLYRKLLLSKVQNFFRAVANIEENRGLPKLPAFCVSKIFNYLKNGDLRKLIRVCNIELDAEICNVSIRYPCGDPFFY